MVHKQKKLFRLVDCLKELLDSLVKSSTSVISELRISIVAPRKRVSEQVRRNPFLLQPWSHVLHQPFRSMWLITEIKRSEVPTRRNIAERNIHETKCHRTKCGRRSDAGRTVVTPTKFFSNLSLEKFKSYVKPLII